MTHREFCTWLEGFMDAASVYATEVQWSKIKEKLAEVKDEEKFVGRGAPTSPFTITPHYPNPWDEPGIRYKYPSDINKVTCEDNTGAILSKRVNGGTATLDTSGHTFTGKQLLKDSTYNYTYKYNDGKSV